MQINHIFDLIRQSFVAFVELSIPDPAGHHQPSSADHHHQPPPSHEEEEEKSVEVDTSTSELRAGISVRMPTSNLGRAVVVGRVSTTHPSYHWCLFRSRKPSGLA